MKLSPVTMFRLRTCLPGLLAGWLAIQPVAFAQQPAPPAAPLTTVQSLRVVPLAGEGEVNDMERGIMAPLVVQVLDQNSRPVEGADVVFRFPLNGPSAMFPGPKNFFSTRTNADGQAAATGWKDNGQAGTFEVRVTATRANEIGEATVRMSNATRITEVVKAKPKRWWSSKWFKIGVVAGAAAVAAVLITRSGDDGPTTVIISPGGPSIGGPQ